MPNIKTRQGKRGLWRWYAYKKGEYKCGSSIVGFDTEKEAAEDAMELFGESAHIQTEDGMLYATERPFAR